MCTMYGSPLRLAKPPSQVLNLLIESTKVAVLTQLMENLIPKDFNVGCRRPTPGIGKGMVIRSLREIDD